MKCQAHKTNGEPCRAWAIAGKSVCRVHGGTGNGRPPTHGRYSHSLPKDLAERYEYFKGDPRILDLKPEIALARSMMERFMHPLTEGAGISAETGGEMRAWVDQVSKIVERCHKVLYGEQYTLTLEAGTVMITRTVAIVNESIDKGLTGQALKDEIYKRVQAEVFGIKGGDK